MRRIFIFFLALFLVPIFLLAILWWQKDTITVFLSDVQRTAAAPTPQSFSEVAGNEAGDDGVEGSEEAEGNEAVESNLDFGDETTELPSPPKEDEPPVVEEEKPSSSDTSSPSASSIPSEFNLAVPFTSQAPLANWDAIHEDACEEASIYMVNAFYESWPAGKIDPNTADVDLLKIVEFERALFGFFESTTAIQTALLVEQMYGYEHVEVIENPTVDDLKAQITAGHPVIALVAGRLLGNPNFTGEGPLYHALVLKGYTETTFVTNDPGTRLGAEYQYDFDVIMNALHDWNGGDVMNGAKVVVVIYPN